MHPDSCRPSESSGRFALIVLAVFVISGTATGLYFGIPIWRKHAAIHDVEKAGGKVKTRDGSEGTFIEVDLSGTEVTDDGLKHLIRLIDLRQLSLVATHVTADGVLELEQAIPGLRVVW
jgi:hypothetical protein